MHICILTRADIFPDQHGAAVKIVETARALDQLGHKCFIISSDRDQYWVVNNGTFEVQDFPPRVRAAQEWFLLKSAEVWAERLCRSLGYPEGELFLYTAMFDPAWLVRVLSLGVAEKIDVFHAEFPGFGICAAFAARTLRKWREWTGGRRPISSVVEHNIEWVRLREFGENSPWIKRLEIASLRAVDEVVTVSEDDRRRLVSVGFDPSAVTIIPHGVNVARYAGAEASRGRVRERYGILEVEPLLIFHGTLHYWPNTEAVRFIVEQLLPRLLQTQPRVKVLICGMNPPEYYRHPAIVFTGAVDDLPEHIAAADIAICPLFAGGGTRLKLLEYMAASRATVSTTKGAEGIPHAGSLRIADTAEEMASEVNFLIENPVEREKLGAIAHDYVQRLSWTAVSQAYVHLYNGLYRGEDWFVRLQGSSNGIDDVLRARTPSKPRTLLLMINRGCNLKCTFCDLWSGHQRLSLAQLQPILTDAVSVGTKVLVLTGGEPLLHPELCAIVRYAKSLGLSVNITTNGTLVESMFEELVGSGVDSLSFSLDGLQQTHEKIRGKEGCFEATCRAIRRVQAETNIATSVYFVATSDNVHELTDVYRLALEMNCRFDFWPVNDAPDQAITTPQQQKQWQTAVALISSEQAEVASRSAFYDDALLYHAGELDGYKRRCLGLVDQYGIDYDGNLIPCCVWEKPELIVGNVLERPLRDLWNDPRVEGYRNQLVTGGCEVPCFNHSLYEFEDSTGLPFVLRKELDA